MQLTDLSFEIQVILICVLYVLVYDLLSGQLVAKHSTFFLLPIMPMLTRHYLAYSVHAPGATQVHAISAKAMCRLALDGAWGRRGKAQLDVAGLRIALFEGRAHIIPRVGPRETGCKGTVHNLFAGKVPITVGAGGHKAYSNSTSVRVYHTMPLQGHGALR